MIWSWRVWICFVVPIGVLTLKRPHHKQVLFWAGGIFLSTLPNLEVARADLLLLPVTFWGLLIAMVLVAAWRKSTSTPVRSVVIVMTLFALGVPAYGSQVFMQDLRVDNLTVICYNSLTEYEPGLTIPQARRKNAQHQLHAYGMDRKSSLRTQYPKLVSGAVMGGRLGADQTNLPFVLRFVFMPEFPGYEEFCQTSLR